MKYEEFIKWCKYKGRYCGVTGRKCTKENCPALNIGKA